MTKYVVNCYDGEYDHFTRAFNSKEEAEQARELLCNLFPIDEGICHEFDFEIREINE